MKHHVTLCMGLLMMVVTHAAKAQAISPATEHASATEQAAITAVVESYPRYVTSGDEKGFESLLLDRTIPFSSVSSKKAVSGTAALQNYQQFREAIFHGAYKYRQTFSNLHISQIGPLAEVSLNFTVERLDGKGQSYTGWKILQLIKNQGTWKIASELYTFDAG